MRAWQRFFYWETMKINRSMAKQESAGIGAMDEIAPDLQVMHAHLRVLFGDLPNEFQDGLIEISWTEKKDGKLKHSKLFPADKLSTAAATAARVNAVPGQSVYFGAALRKSTTPRWRRAADSHFYAATGAYADFDGPGDLERAEVICRERNCEATFKVYTGRHPHERAQLWWRLASPISDPEMYRRLNRALAEALGGDPTVINPGRVMRLAGSIAWPRKKGRIVERTELVIPEAGA